MVRKKKKTLEIAFFITFFSFVSLFLFSLENSFFVRHLSRIFSEWEVNYDSIKLERQKIHFHHLLLTHFPSNTYKRDLQVNIDKAEVSLLTSASFSLKVHLLFSHPHIQLKKDFSFGKSRFFSFFSSKIFHPSFCIEGGTIESSCKRPFCFSLDKEKFLAMRRGETEERLEILRQEGLYSLSLFQIDLEELFPLFSFLGEFCALPSMEKIEGKVSGKVLFQEQKGSFFLLSSDMEVNNLLFHSNALGVKGKADFVHFFIEEMKGKKENSELFSLLGQKVQTLHASLRGGNLQALFPSHSWKFSQLEGSFFSHPEIGFKFDIQGSSLLGKEKKNCKFSGKGVQSHISSWAEIFLELSPSLKMSLHARQEKQEEGLVWRTKVYLQGEEAELFSLLGKKTSSESFANSGKIFSAISIVTIGDRRKIEGNLCITPKASFETSSEEKWTISLLSEKKNSLKDLAKASKSSFFSLEEVFSQISSGTMKGEGVVLERWNPWIGKDSSRPLRDLSFQGIANLSMGFDKKKVSIEVQGKDLAWSQVFLQGTIQKFSSSANEEKIQVVFNKENRTWQAKIPLFDGNFFLPKQDLCLKVERAEAYLQNQQWHFILPVVSWQDLRFSGKAFLILSEVPAIKVLTDSMEGTTASFQKFVQHFDPKASFFHEMGGTINNKEGDFLATIFLFDEKLLAQWKFNANIEDASFSFSESAWLEEGKAHLSWNSEQEEIEFANVEGKLLMGKGKKIQEYNLFCPHFRVEKNSGKRKWAFDVRLAQKCWDVLRLKGRLEEGFFLGQEGRALFLEKEQSHFFSVPLCFSHFILDRDFQVVDAKLSLEEEATSFFSQLSFLSNFGFFPFPSFLQKKCSGKFCFDIHKGKEWEIFLQTKDLAYEEKSLGPFAFILRGSKEAWRVEEGLIGEEGFFHLELKKEKEDWKIPFCEVKKGKGFLWQWEGVFREKDFCLEGSVQNLLIDLSKVNRLFSSRIHIPLMEGRIEAKGSFLFSFSPVLPRWEFFWESDSILSHGKIANFPLKAKAPFHVEISSERGLSIENLKIEFEEPFHCFCTLPLSSYDFSSEKWSFKSASLQFFLPSFTSDSSSETVKMPLFHNYKGFFSFLQNSLHLEKDLAFTLDVECSFYPSSFSLYSKRGYFSSAQRKLAFKNLFFACDEGKYFLNFQWLYHGDYYQVNHQIEKRDQTFSGVCFLKENEEASQEKKPLRIEWSLEEKKGLSLQDISGSFSGLECAFHQETSEDPSNEIDLSGSVKIDFSKARKLFPEEFSSFCKKFSLGKGYGILGKIKIFKDKPSFLQLSGTFFGKDLELLHYRLRTCLGHIFWDGKSLQIHEVKISDKAGSAKIKNFYLAKDKEKGWKFSLPLLEISEFRPSLLERIDQSKRELKPLVVREFKMENVEGEIGREESFTGKGFLTFINSFKRGHSLLDLPSDVLGRIFGLDSDLLIPVQGKIEYEIKDKKVSLTNLTDAFSEGERSKFFLIDKEGAPFMDFEGNLHIGVKMKQYVLFKFTENFVISIDGTLEDPQFHLKKERGFLFWK